MRAFAAPVEQTDARKDPAADQHAPSTGWSQHKSGFADGGEEEVAAMYELLAEVDRPRTSRTVRGVSEREEQRKCCRLRRGAEWKSVRSCGEILPGDHGPGIWINVQYLDRSAKEKKRKR